MEEASQSAIFVRGRDENGWFQEIFFDIMSHLSETSAGSGGEVVRRTLLHGKAGEPFIRLICVGD